MPPVCCIYKVPSSLRNVKPEAYRPRCVTIGLRNRSVKATKDDEAEASTNPGEKNKTKNKYKKMENRKKEYLQSFTERVGKEFVEKMKKTIKAEEVNIRRSYDESTEWVKPEKFVDHILKDSIFIMEFMIQCKEGSDDDTMITGEVKEDLMLLENQLPYFILEQLFGSDMATIGLSETLEEFIMGFFSLKLTKNTKFMHFTDMYRCVYEEQNPMLTNLSGAAITKLENADTLSRAGVQFKTLDQLSYREREKLNRGYSGNNQPMTSILIEKETGDEYSLHVLFNKGCLVMPTFHAAEKYDTLLRNVIAYERCQDGVTPLISNYIHFINFLITSEEDVKLLTTEGVLRNDLGSPRLVVEMVNNLNRGLRVSQTSQYHNIAINLRAHNKSRRNRCCATLKRNYFPDLLTGTATLAAAFLLFLTVVGTVASVIQTYKSFDEKGPNYGLNGLYMSPSS